MEECVNFEIPAYERNSESAEPELEPLPPHNGTFFSNVSGPSIPTQPSFDFHMRFDSPKSSPTSRANPPTQMSPADPRAPSKGKEQTPSYSLGSPQSRPSFATQSNVQGNQRSKDGLPLFSMPNFEGLANVVCKLFLSEEVLTQELVSLSAEQKLSLQVWLSSRMKLALPKLKTMMLSPGFAAQLTSWFRKEEDFSSQEQLRFVLYRCVRGVSNNYIRNCGNPNIKGFFMNYYPNNEEKVNEMLNFSIEGLNSRESAQYFRLLCESLPLTEDIKLYAEKFFLFEYKMEIINKVQLANKKEKFYFEELKNLLPLMQSRHQLELFLHKIRNSLF